MAQKLGVQFRYGVTIDRLLTADGKISGIATSVGELHADAYVLALGSYSSALLRGIDLHVPIYPIKGYSITVPISDTARAPESTIMDETFKVAITRLGDRIRVGGTAEIAGFDLRLHARRRETLEHSLTDLFPDSGDVAKAEFWCGLRPMTPDGTPVLGKTRYGNLFLNSGHGTLGWTMACGSGRVLADIVSGKTPDIDLEGLSMERYRS
jgi:D-amino-acid dehydrogenase